MINKLIKSKTHQKAFKQFLTRLSIFLTIYTVISVTHGDLTNWLHGYNAGSNNPYVFFLIFPLLGIITYAFIKKINSIKCYKNNPKETIVFLLIGLTFLYAPIQNRLFLITDHLLISYFTPFVIGFFCIFLGIFNNKFWEKFKFETGIVSLAIISFILIQILVENHWLILSNTIVDSLKVTLPLFSDQVFIEGVSVKIENFKVSIGPSCAGFYSLVSFLFLYLVTILYVAKYKKLKTFQTLIALITGLLLIFFLNIVRVTIIILVGAFYSPELAIEFFHEYLSAIFLLAILALYIYKVIPKLIKKSNLKKK